MPNEISPICSLIFKSTISQPIKSVAFLIITATNIEPTYIGILTPVKSVKVLPIYVPNAMQNTSIENCIKKT